ncbi:hypothetical protein [Paraliobacillus ryukyuensis]|uniref:hypothetical protein n=1 Tax=Paraliobacillus ryukyuensis TaxID=200904 RepID=UPI0009A7BE8B|nr:hypothetical protein [Paraliobacillus ryukyuensis]
MTTRDNVISNFHTEFQSPTVLPDGIEDQFLIKAVGDFQLDLYPISYSTSTKDFEESISISEEILLGKLMYKHYLSRELDRVLKLNNIVGKDISLTSMAGSKSSIQKRYTELVGEIDEVIYKLKDNTFY